MDLIKLNKNEKMKKLAKINVCYRKVILCMRFGTIAFTPFPSPIYFVNFALNVTVWLLSKASKKVT